MISAVRAIKTSWIVWVALALGASGCASTSKQIQDPQRHQAELALLQPGSGIQQASISALHNALAYFEQMDDAAAQWQANYKLASCYMARNQADQALLYARRAHQLAERLAVRSNRYDSAIQMGQLTQESDYFASAESLAATDLEKALALTGQGRFDAARPLFLPLDAQQQPATFAYLYYQYGKHAGDVAAVTTALTLYRQSGDGYGVVDSLYLAARLSSQPAAARDYGERALRAAGHLPDPGRQRRIQSWLASLPE